MQCRVTCQTHKSLIYIFTEYIQLLNNKRLTLTVKYTHYAAT